jgi:hypothetical protein
MDLLLVFLYPGLNMCQQGSVECNFVSLVSDEQLKKTHFSDI